MFFRGPATPVLLLSACLTSPLQSLELSELWKGLPTSLPSRFLETEGFLSVQEIPEEMARQLRAPRNYAPAPIASTFQFQGENISVNDRAAQLEVFTESVYAHIPEDSVIRVFCDDKNREVWDYPTGTSVVHLITFKDARHTVFELRLVRKLNSTQWAFGSYSPAPKKPETLELNTYTKKTLSHFDLQIAEGPRLNQQVYVEVQRLKLDTCQACHFSNSPHDYQYAQYDSQGKLDWKASVTVTGPCGFGPSNPTARTEWKRLYQATHKGRSPFVGAEGCTPTKIPSPVQQRPVQSR